MTTGGGLSSGSPSLRRLEPEEDRFGGASVALSPPVQGMSSAASGADQ